MFGEFVNKGSFDETLGMQPKEMLHVPLSDALLSMKQQPKGDEHGDEVIFGEFSYNLNTPADRGGLLLPEARGEAFVRTYAAEGAAYSRDVRVPETRS